MNNIYKNKYLKYKSKYLSLEQYIQKGGNITVINDDKNIFDFNKSFLDNKQIDNINRPSELFHNLKTNYEYTISYTNEVKYKYMNVSYIKIVIYTSFINYKHENIDYKSHKRYNITRLCNKIKINKIYNSSISFIDNLSKLTDNAQNIEFIKDLVENFDNNDSDHTYFNEIYNAINALTTTTNITENALNAFKDALKSILFLKKVTKDADFIYYIYKIKKNRTTEIHSTSTKFVHDEENDITNIKIYPELKFLYNKDIVLAAVKQTTSIFGDENTNNPSIEHYKNQIRGYIFVNCSHEGILLEIIIKGIKNNSTLLRHAQEHIITFLIASEVSNEKMLNLKTIFTLAVEQDGLLLEIINIINKKLFDLHNEPYINERDFLNNIIIKAVSNNYMALKFIKIEELTYPYTYNVYTALKTRVPMHEITTVYLSFNDVLEEKVNTSTLLEILSENVELKDTLLKIITAAVTNNGLALNYKILSLFNDNEKYNIILVAVTNNGLALNYKILSLFNDNEKYNIILAAVTNNGLALNSLLSNYNSFLTLFNSFTQKEKYKIILVAVTNNGLALTSKILLSFNNNEKYNIILAAVTNNGLVLNSLLPDDNSFLILFNSFTQKEKYKIILVAVTNNGLVLNDSYLNFIIGRKNKAKIITAAVTNNGSVLKDSHFNLFNDRYLGLIKDIELKLKIILGAVTNNGLVLKNSHLNLFNNIDSKLTEETELTEEIETELTEEVETELTEKIEPKTELKRILVEVTNKNLVLKNNSLKLFNNGLPLNIETEIKLKIILAAVTNNSSVINDTTVYLLDLFKETNNSFSIILPLVTNDVSYFEVIESTTLGTFSQNEQLAIILAAITNNSNALNKERLLKFDSINHLNIMIQAADINGLVIDNTELMSVFSKNKDDLINIMTHACSNNSLVLETEVFKEYSDDNKITFILAVLNGKDNNKLLKSINNENLKIIKKYFNNKDNNNEDKEKNLTLIVNNYYLEKDKEDIMKRIHACFQNIAPSMTHMDAIKLLTSDQLSYNEDILYILENILDYIRDIKK